MNMNPHPMAGWYGDWLREDEVWMHWSVEPLTLDKLYAVEQANPSFYHDKPDGLWVSDERRDDGWRSWCTSEGYDGVSGIPHKVTFHKDAKLLRLSGPHDLDRFTDRWGASDEDDEFYKGRPAIQWGDVAKEFDGILITPYVWERRLKVRTSWYNTWDCASGCIWNPRAIASIKHVGGSDA